MYIGVKDIKKLFSDSRNLLKESSQSYCLFNWIALEGAPVPYEEHLLYVCEYSFALKDVDFIPDMHVLCLIKQQDNPEVLSEMFPASVNILLLATENPDSIYTQLIRFFDAQCGISLFADTLLDVLFSDGGIQAMVDRAYLAFGNPILVFDGGFNLVAASWEEVKKANIREEIIENRGFTSIEFDMANSRNNIHKRVQKSEEPILSYNPELGYDQLLCAIDTQKDLGHIVVSATNRPLSPMDVKMMIVLKKSIDQQLKKNEFTRNAKGFNYEYFLKDVLDGKIAAGKSFLDRLDYLGNEFCGNMYCLVIETALSSVVVNTHHIRSLFESRLLKTKTLIYNGKIVVILSVPENRYLPKENLEAAVNICRENNLFAGLSNCFQSIIEISEYYKQALRAIELGLGTVDKPDLFLYEAYYLEHMKNIFMQKESPITFCHPKMKLLLEYDKKHNSELARTLYMYLIHERNIAAVSAAMHMHRNSVVYRIKRINSLIGEDLENHQERQYLILSYAIINNCPVMNETSE